MDDHAELLWREAAVRRVLELRSAALSGQPTERVPLEDVAGRTLAEPVVAEADAPPRDHATMDGYALDARDDYPLTVREEEVYPGADPPSLGAGEAIPVATGAPLPEAANAVLKREDVAVEDGRLRGPEVAPGAYTYERGTNVEAGETLFEADERLSPKDAILLRDLGIETPAVHEPFSAAVLATGTEIHEGGSNDLDSPMLAGLVRAWGHRATYEGSVPDDYGAVEETIADLAREHDVVVTTGGTSVGTKDHVVRALDALGSVAFHRVRIRPGKPVAVARLPDDDATAVAIPGKPVGAHTVATLVARPFFAGDVPLPTVPATLARNLATGPDGFEYAVPVVLDDGGERSDESERPTAMPLGHVDSPLPIYEETFDPSVLSQSTRATRADGFFLAKEGRAAGDRVDVVPYPVVESG